jgi:hypothetical protein
LIAHDIFPDALKRAQSGILHFTQADYTPPTLFDRPLRTKYFFYRNKWYILRRIWLFYVTVV